MHKMISRISALLLLVLFSLNLAAQQTMPDEPVQMADGLRSNGKIYVVVAVVVTILAGVVAYLVSIDRKISKMEKDK
ncbi:CcmD family protein [Flavihumibacter rivuli]|uniref:CcmD family protein n=1 Tax=Flavihumibacter rivuli TaxID=2838156 RepID=UPI001BDE03B1|nr:CcmD family protein [Flavihumibacter rivuli]ULQ58182.1 CcmD family protein [Flavihumibacter rivuli]